MHLWAAGHMCEPWWYVECFRACDAPPPDPPIILSVPSIPHTHSSDHEWTIYTQHVVTSYISHNAIQYKTQVCFVLIFHFDEGKKTFILFNIKSARMFLLFRFLDIYFRDNRKDKMRNKKQRPTEGSGSDRLGAWSSAGPQIFNINSEDSLISIRNRHAGLRIDLNVQWTDRCLVYKMTKRSSVSRHAGGKKPENIHT